MSNSVWIRNEGCGQRGKHKNPWTTDRTTVYWDGTFWMTTVRKQHLLGDMSEYWKRSLREKHWSSTMKNVTLQLESKAIWKKTGSSPPVKQHSCCKAWRWQSHAAGALLSAEGQGTCEIGWRINAAKCEALCYGDRLRSHRRDMQPIQSGGTMFMIPKSHWLNVDQFLAWI